MTQPHEQLAGDRVLILDFGSQYTQLIARRVRELEVYAEIRPFRIERAEVEAFGLARYPQWGPNSVTDEGAPTIGVGSMNSASWFWDLLRLQLTQLLGGKCASRSPRVRRSDGPQTLTRVWSQADEFGVWMSRGDMVESIPDGFVVHADTESTPHAAIADQERRIYGVQFHPEAHHAARRRC